MGGKTPKDVTKPSGKRTAPPPATGMSKAERMKFDLARKKCVFCGSIAWLVTSTVGRLHNLKCKGCRNTAKYIDPETAAERATREFDGEQVVGE